MRSRWRVGAVTVPSTACGAGRARVHREGARPRSTAPNGETAQIADSGPSTRAPSCSLSVSN
jgi:hypothetical protein